ncbi:MAG: hypothetical protein P8Y71_23540 [Pseudolabrys sp.]|jgi:hypothetical protein
MEEIEIVRLNIERFRDILQTELDWPKRLMIENMLREFKDRLAASESNGGAPK